MSELPDGWTSATVGDLAERIQYGTSAKTNEDATGVPVLRMGNIDSGRLRLADLKYLPIDHDEFPELLLERGDVLFNRTNSPELVGKTAVYDGVPERASFASYLLRVRLKDFEPRLLSHYLNSTYGRSWIASVVSQQVGQANVNGTKLRALTIPVPPPTEQRRIVAKLDDVLARSRRAKQALDAVPPLLEKLRQSILAAAFRGDLTADWRAKNPDVEPADALLARIRVERRKKWEEAELAKMKAKGKPPSDDRWKAKYKEPEVLDASGLPELPTGWAWATIEQLLCEGGLAYGILKPGAPDVHGVPMLRVMDVGDGELTGTDIVRVSPALDEEFKRTRLAVGDVLLSIMATLGRTMVVPAALAGANVNRALSVLKPVDRMMSGYLCAYFRSPAFQQTFLDNQLGSAQLRINLGDLAQFPIPIPIEGEASLIATIAEQKLSTMRNMLGRVEDAAALLKDLDAGTLAKAFRGELVMEPSDVVAGAAASDHDAASTDPRA